MRRDINRADARAVNLGELSVYQGGGAKFEIKHKNRSLQKSKLVNWGATLVPALAGA